MSAASKDLIDAAADRAQAQNEYDEAKDKFDYAYEGVKKVALDMKGGNNTRPGTATNAKPDTDAERVYNYSDLLNFADSDSADTRTDISYKSIFETKLTGNATNTNIDTLKEVIQHAGTALVNGTTFNFNNSQYELLRDANAYMKAMKELWDDKDKEGNNTREATKNSIVGASKELWDALNAFNNLNKNDPEGADVVAKAMLKRLEEACDNMKSLLEDYKSLFQALHTTDFSESELTALVSGGEDFTDEIDAWIGRLTAMEAQMKKNSDNAVAGTLDYDKNNAYEVKTKDKYGINIIVDDFVAKFKNYVKENVVDLPQAKKDWAEAVVAYNDAVSATKDGGAKKEYLARIQKDQRVIDPYHSDKDADGNYSDSSKVTYQKNDYEGLKKSSAPTTAAEGATEEWWLTNNNDILVKTYSVERTSTGTANDLDPSLNSYVTDAENYTLTEGGEKLWQTIGREGVDDTNADYLAMPANSNEGKGNYTYYGYPSTTDVSTLTGTKPSVYTHTENTTWDYTKAIIAVTKADADDDGSEFTTLVPNTYLTGDGQYKTVAALKTAMDNAKNDTTTPTNNYAQAIADTEAALKVSTKANTIRDGAKAAAEAALAADESAIRINILLDDAAENLDWTSALADGATAKVADFYYNYILGAGQTSEKLIDSVELDPSLTAKDYKELVFDLNVKLDSAQITYADDQRTITTTAVDANDAFGMKATVGRESTDGKGVAVTWDGSDSVSPTTTYRVGTDPVTPKKVDAKTVTGQTGDNVDLNADDYIYEIEVSTKKYYGRSLADGTKFYYFGDDGSAIVPTDSITLNIVE